MKISVHVLAVSRVYTVCQIHQVNPHHREFPGISPLRTQTQGIPLVVQWLGLCTSTVGGPGSIPGWGTKILQSAPAKKKNAADSNPDDAKLPPCSNLILVIIPNRHCTIFLNGV